MNGRRWSGLAAGLLLAASVGAGPSVVDDTDHRVAVASPAEGIISLAPHTTELIYAAGAGDALVATVANADYPRAARELPRIGDADGLNIEAIVAREPDLVVAWGSGNPDPVIERLRALGIAVYVDEPRALGDIATTLLDLGRLAGTTATARAAGDRFRQRLARLRKRYADRPTLAVFYQVWADPLMTINGDHVISDVIRGCGGRNVFADLSGLAPRVSIESVIARDPAVIVTSASRSGEGEPLAMWRDWPEIEAVARDRLITLPPDLLVRHTPRILDGMARLCRRLEAIRSHQAAPK